MPGDPINYTYAPGASLVVAGNSYPVAGFTLELTTGGTPRLVLQIDPFHIEGDAATPAVAPNIGNFVTTWKTLQDAIDSGNRDVQFDFDAQLERSSNAPGNYDRLQEFSISGWIMTSAGMRNVGSRGGFAVEVEAVHPFQQFQESSAYLLSAAQLPIIQPDEITGENVFDALISTMTAYLRVHEETVPDILEANYDAVLKDYSQMIDHLKEYMEWDGNYTGKPCDGLWPDDLDNYVFYNLLDYVRAATNAASWDRFVHTICAQWFLSIIPTFAEEKLKIRPIEPWQTPTINIYDSDVVSINLPPVDPTPIKGVMGILSDVVTRGAVTYSLNDEGERDLVKDEISIIEESLRGRELSLQVPSWYHGTVKIANKVDASGKLPEEGESLVSFETESNSTNASGAPQSSIDIEDVKSLQEGVGVAIAKELFLENYRLHYQVSLSTRLLLKADGAKTPGGYLLPGFVARLLPNPEISGESDPLLDFYVTKVVHSVNCAGAQAGTQIIGSFVRQSNTPTLKKFDMVKGVATNAVYPPGE